MEIKIFDHLNTFYRSNAMIYLNFRLISEKLTVFNTMNDCNINRVFDRKTQANENGSTRRNVLFAKSLISYLVFQRFVVQSFGQNDFARIIHSDLSR